MKGCNGGDGQVASNGEGKVEEEEVRMEKRRKLGRKGFDQNQAVGPAPRSDKGRPVETTSAKDPFTRSESTRRRQDGQGFSRAPDPVFGVVVS